MLDKGYNIYSQWGEDGVIEYITNELGIKNGCCCEFGMEGILYSNTFNLVKNKNWSAIYIECNEKHIKRIEQLENIKIINKKIELYGNNTLDNLLAETTIKKDFDLLSIDIDGNDYYVWKSLKNYIPKIIIIEINPMYKPGVLYTYDERAYGTSFTSMVKLGISKGYTLVCMTGNLIFVKSELLKKTKLESYLYNDYNLLFLDDAIMVNKREINFRRYMKRNLL
jgi:hypothetical protein